MPPSSHAQPTEPASRPEAVATPPEPEELNFTKGGGLVPAVVQHAHTGQMLMLGYMNQEAFDKTLAAGVLWFYSRSKQRLWQKGETSGHILKLCSYHVDCDRDTLLVLALPAGPTCHLGKDSCFSAPSYFSPLSSLEQVIATRRSTATPSSYTQQLLTTGIKDVAQKIGEEAVETLLALTAESNQRVVAESADLIYHLLVGLQLRSIEWQEVIAELQRRSSQQYPVPRAAEANRTEGTAD